MTVRTMFFLSFVVCLCAGMLAAAEGEYKVEAIEQAPDGVSEDIAPLLSRTGHQVSGPDGPIATVWLVNKLMLAPGFTPTLNVKYPFEEGQLIGAISVPEGQNYSDFRGQEIKPGVYTLRYGVQPMDGNHIGTSDTYDFLLAIPAKLDKDPLPFKFVMELHEKSAKAAGTAHPAIFSLLPAEQGAEGASIEHEPSKEFQVLQLSAPTDGEPKTQAIRLVVVGKGEV